jgi:hypothetical protein
MLTDAWVKRNSCASGELRAEECWHHVEPTAHSDTDPERRGELIEPLSYPVDSFCEDASGECFTGSVEHRNGFGVVESCGKNSVQHAVAGRCHRRSGQCTGWF